jgi:hypothetical protein
MEAVMASFQTLSWHLPGGTEENNEQPQDRQSPGQDINPGPPKYREVLTTCL